MAGIYGSHPEDRARENELNRHLAKQHEGEEMSNLVEDMMHQAVTDAPLFRTYDDDYDVIDRDQVMRCLANLDKAIVKFNHHALLYAVHGKVDRAEIDAIFTSLTIMQRNLQSAIEHEAEKVMEIKRELEHFGGEK